MPLSSIVVIVIRLFALHSLLRDLSFWSAALLGPVSFGQPGSYIAMRYAAAAILLVAVVGLWVLAPSIAGLVCRGVDANVALAGLSRGDLYSFGFVFLGLFFVLSSVADVINWLHYFAMASHAVARESNLDQNLYRLTRPVLTLVAGLSSLLGAPRWTRRILAYEQKHHAG